MIRLSVIIPARNEFPNVVHTIYSIMHCWEADGFDPKELELIIVDNCSNDDKYPQRGTAGTTSYLEGRSIYYNACLRVLRDPIAGNHSARNKGAKIARGKYLFFSDAHMAYKPGFFKEILRTVDESGGLVHGCIAWMGAWPITESGTGYAYTLKIGEDWKGTWNNYKLADDWWYIPAQGHCSVAVLREQFLDFGGYPSVHRVYGGGEMYLDMKWWMFGSTVAISPKSVGFHLASGRGYSYNHDDYTENVLGVTYALGCDDWRERTAINTLRHGRKEVVDAILARGEKEYAKDREFVAKRKKFSFNELLVNRPWDAKNKERHGKSNGGLLIYHDTWIKLLDQSMIAKEAYENSKYQKDLDTFIRTNLKEFIYKGGQ